MIERLRYDPKSVVSPDGDVRSIHDVVDGEIPETTRSSVTLEAEQAEVETTSDELDEARKLVARVEDEAEKHQLQGASVEKAEQKACTDLRIPYGTYDLALERVAESKRADSQRAIGAHSIIETVRDQRRAGMSEDEAQLFDAQNRAHDENRRPGIGRAPW